MPRSTGSRARIPNLFGNVLRLDRLDRAAGRAAIVKPLERWGELEGDPVSIEDELVGRVLDGVGDRADRARPGRPGLTVANGPRARDRGAVPAARHAAALGRRADGGVGDAARRDARRARRGGPDRRRPSRARDRGARHPPSATSRRGSSITSSRHRARRSRTRRPISRSSPTRREDVVARVVAVARRPSHPPYRRERALGDLPRRPRRRGARLEDALRGGAGGRSGRGRRRGAGTAAWASLPSARSSGWRSACRTRGLCVLAAQRRSRAGARRQRAGAHRARRAARLERALAARQRSGARARARRRGGEGRSDGSCGGSAATDPRQVTCAGAYSTSDTRSSGLDVSGSGRHAVVVGDDQRSARARPRVG